MNGLQTISAVEIEATTGFPPSEWATTRPTERVARLKTRLLDVERGRYATGSYRQTETYHFLFVLLQIESNAGTFSPGWFDQTMLA